ncbi:MAG: hypothetical protein ACRDFS_07980 [Chloroflexota bacterium]
MALASQSLQVGTTLPRSSVPYPVSLGTHPRVGDYSYKLIVYWKRGRVSRHGTFRIWT